MKTLALLAALTLNLAHVSAAHATWTPLINCENNTMVIDSDSPYNYPGTQRQLVVRNQEILRYFATKAMSVGQALNEKGEMVVLVAALENGAFMGNIGQQTSVVVSRLNSADFRVSIRENGYRGSSTELANWDFHGCSQR